MRDQGIKAIGPGGTAREPAATDRLREPAGLTRHRRTFQLDGVHPSRMADSLRSLAMAPGATSENPSCTRLYALRTSVCGPRTRDYAARASVRVMRTRVNAVRMSVRGVRTRVYAARTSVREPRTREYAARTREYAERPHENFARTHGDIADSDA